MDATRGVPEDTLRRRCAPPARYRRAALRGGARRDDIAPGVYRWPDLRPARPGRCEMSSTGSALEQGLATDAAFVVIGATDVAALDDREYREAQLAAGLVEGRLHLLAYALGARPPG